RYRVRDARGRAPGARDPAAAVAAAGGRAGPLGRDPRIGSGPRARRGQRLALGPAARHLRCRLHRVRGPRVRPPVGGDMTSTGTRATRLLGAATLAALALTAVMALVVSPPDEVQGDAVRLLYLHVPTAWVAMY